jgi:hypothetical protein
MAWRLRRSRRLPGGFRLNISKSGLGYSWGFRGFRIGRDSRGRIVRTVSIPGTGLSNRQYLSDSTPQQENPVQQSSGMGCCGCVGTAIIALVAVAFLGTVTASGSTNSLIVVCVLAVGGYFAWRTLRAPNSAAPTPQDVPPLSYEPLGQEVRIVFEELREPIKNELRKSHGASTYDQTFELEFIELICRFAALDGTVNDSEGKVFLDILKVLHPRTYAGMSATDGASLLNGHLQRHPEFLRSPVEHAMLLKLAQQAGVLHWTKLKELMCKVALQVALADGPLSEREKAELEALQRMSALDAEKPISDPWPPAAASAEPVLQAIQPSVNTQAADMSLLGRGESSLAAASPSSAPSLDSLKQATKDLIEGLEELLKVELREMRHASIARELLEQNIREVIIRFGLSEGNVSLNAARLYLELFRTLHPRSFGAWKVDDALNLLRGIVEKDEGTYSGVLKKPFTLGLIETFDASHGTIFAKSFRDLLLAIAVFASAPEGTLSDEKEAEINRLKTVLEAPE